MGACFLRDLTLAGYTVVTVLKADQYTGIDSFTEVGTFVPLTYDRDGQVVREVASACFALPLPESSGQTLPLRVALIRDWHRQIITPKEEEAQDERNAHKRGWWRDGWRAEPTPAPPTQAKLIPIVTTTTYDDAVELAATYTRRWAAQENIIRDFLLPLQGVCLLQHYISRVRLSLYWPAAAHRDKHEVASRQLPPTVSHLARGLRQH